MPNYINAAKMAKHVTWLRYDWILTGLSLYCLLEKTLKELLLALPQNLLLSYSTSSKLLEYRILALSVLNMLLYETSKVMPQPWYTFNHYAPLYLEVKVGYKTNFDINSREKDHLVICNLPERWDSENERVSGWESERGQEWKTER